MATNRLFNLDGRIVLGAALLLFGTLLLLDNVDIIEVGSVWRLWPLILVAVGVNKILGSENRREFGSGAWWIFLGLWFFVSIQHVFGLGFRDTWPMLIMAWGVSEIWKALAQRSHVSIAKENGNATD
ncbi:MAG TPA: DUF5668 domain-containing protein [Bacteroidota bacterium]